MDAQRRLLLKAMGAVPLALSLPLQAKQHAPVSYLVCRIEDRHSHYCCGVDADGSIRFQQPLPSRGHGFAWSPKPELAVAIARRPGTWLQVINTVTGKIIQTITAQAGRHYYGHGMFSADGSRLFVPENDISTGQGLIGVYDADAGFKRLGEFSTHGIGPHEIRRMPNGDLAIANGGIHTHPDSGRKKLNLDSMQPSLVILSPDGHLRLQAELPAHQHQLSIRHMDVSDKGDVAIAMQYQGSKRDRVPLVAMLDGGELVALSPDGNIDRRMHHYAGSVVFDREAETLAVSSPRGGVVAFWDVASRELIHTHELADVCAMEAGEEPNSFLAMGYGGRSALILPRSQSAIDIEIPGHGSMDNHAMRFRG